jgi:hypothetical protein
MKINAAAAAMHAKTVTNVSTPVFIEFAVYLFLNSSSVGNSGITPNMP